MRIHRRRKSKARGASENFDVSMSPLIDCVFLLLIFFLVTTMLKKTEKRIPVKLPEPELALAEKASTNEITIGMTRAGEFVQPDGERDAFGRKMYADIKDLPAHLRKLAADGGRKKPLVLEAQQGTEFQRVVKTLDICKIQGFDNVTLRVVSDNFQSTFTSDETPQR
ncbi:ExbD/TolR family protein [Sulfuriroseicoccus oceanibius]|uniref:Biopolymer transporter ExbD n=1 Tax=Sulfuriroseicoccus oceanibius TaxID=2707525 RepID=A0A7T7F0U4_9BACT|nr:biopolymer transporter ExbD [Sulfuriroseicoccus oceanibius]QQL44745.1 biopolymer transporter ExbD [Sulfuriroseicoccus oceanibius]